MAKPLLTGGNGKANDFVGTANAQVPTWSESAQEWVLGPGGGSGGGGAIFYLNSAAAAASPTTNVPYTGGSGATLAYFDPSQVSQTFNATASTRLSPPTGELPSDGSWAIVQGFMSDAALGLTALPPGLWDFNLWAQASTGAGATQVQFRIKVGVYDNSANTLTYLFTSDDVYIYDPTVAAQYAVSVVIGANTIAATDRLYIEIDARASANNRTATFYFGSNKPSHVHTTIPVLVNLATDVTGVLPVANGGTGAATTQANKVFAGPTSGADAAPGFRALVAADVSGITPYDLRGKFIGNPASSIVLDSFVAGRNFTIGATNTLHKFWADEKTAGADVVITVRRTRAGSTSTIFTATSTSADTALNGYYPMTVSSVANNDILVDDLVEVVMGTTQPAFSTPIWTIYGTA